MCPATRERAEALLEAVERAPLRVHERAEALAADARRQGDRLGEAAALRVMGVAERLVNRPAVALDHFNQALRLAIGDARLTGLIRVSRAASLQQVGLINEGLADIELARTFLDGPELAMADYQRATLLARLGRVEEAGRELDDAIERLVGFGDRRCVAGALTNRGLLRCYQHELDAAVEDLRRARALYVELGLTGYAGTALHNLGYAEARRGHIASALEHYERAQDELTAAGMPPAGLAVEHAEILTEAGLFDEARNRLQEAVVALSSSSNNVDLAEAHLALGELEELSGRPVRARRHAQLARRLFDAQGRDAWAARARLLELDASGDIELGAHDALVGLLRDAGLIEAGWRAHVAQLRALTPLAERLERLHELRRQVEESPAWLRFRVEEEIVAATVESAGPGAAAAVQRAVHMAVREITTSRLALGAPLTHYARRIFATHRSLAFKTGDPEVALGALEATVGVTWRGTADGPDGAPLTAFRRAAGDAAGIALGEADGTLMAIVAASDGVEVVELGAYADFVARAASAAALMSTLAQPSPRPDTARTAVATVLDRAQDLERAWSSWWPAASRYVLAVRPELTTLPLALTRLTDSTPVVFVPSLSTWARAQARPAMPPTTWYALHGPDLEQGRAECGALAELGYVTTPANRTAGLADLRRAVAAGAGLHLAAHARLRSGNPLLSSVRLCDGNVHLDELETFGALPTDVVLAVCHGGAPMVSGAGESLGIASMLLRRGSRRVVASWAPTPDRPVTVQFMTELHRAMQTLDPAAALVEATRRLSRDDPHALVLAGSVVAFEA